MVNEHCKSNRKTRKIIFKHLRVQVRRVKTVIYVIYVKVCPVTTRTVSSFNQQDCLNQAHPAERLLELIIRRLADL